MADIEQYKKRPLPKIEDLYLDLELASKQNELNRLLNCAPKKEWVKQHPFAKKEIIVNGQKQKVPIDYLPVEIVEYLLTCIYIKWRKEIKQVQVIANSIVVTLRVHVLDPITGEWDWQDGVGAAPIRTEKGAAATDFSKVQDSAVQTGAPAAESYAFKDAAEGFGKLFGKDLNRAEGGVNYTQMMDTKFGAGTVLELPEELITVINETMDKVKLFDEIYKNNQEYHSNPLFMKLLNNRKIQLSNGATANSNK